MNARDPVDTAVIDVPLVRRLVAQQFPHWAQLPIRPVERQGNDNRTFRLGDDMAVRLPSARRYEAGVEKEQRWLPLLVPQLPLAIPVPLAMGMPTSDYPWRWSIHRWLDGETADKAHITDRSEFAAELALFLRALHAIDAGDGPSAGVHSFFRGASLANYDAQTRDAIAALGRRIDARAATDVWDAALLVEYRGAPVWFHGDIAADNLLVKDGKLSAVIDFGTCGVGDPACDLVIAWTFFEGASRERFRAGLPLDSDTWARARGWALWKALIVLASGRRPRNQADARAARIVDDVVAELGRTV